MNPIASKITLVDPDRIDFLGLALTLVGGRSRLLKGSELGAFG